MKSRVIFRSNVGAVEEGHRFERSSCYGGTVFGTVRASRSPRPSSWSASSDLNRIRRGLQSRASTTSASDAWQGIGESNSAIPVLETGALPIEPIPRGASLWWGLRGLSPDVRRRQILSLLCIHFTKAPNNVFVDRCSAHSQLTSQRQNLTKPPGFHQFP